MKRIVKAVLVGLFLSTAAFSGLAVSATGANAAACSDCINNVCTTGLTVGWDWCAMGGPGGQVCHHSSLFCYND